MGGAHLIELVGLGLVTEKFDKLAKKKKLYHIALNSPFLCHKSVQWDPLMQTHLAFTQSVLIRGCCYFRGCLIYVSHVWNRTQCLHYSGCLHFRGGCPQGQVALYLDEYNFGKSIQIHQI